MKLFWYLLDYSPTITISQSTIQHLPTHVQKLLKSLNRSASKFEVFQALIIAIGCEVAFIGDWCYCDGIQNAYNVSWTNLLDRRLLQNFTIHNSDEILKFKFIFAPQTEITLFLIEAGDLMIISAVPKTSDNSIISTRSLAFSFSRYLVTKSLNFSCLPANFRNLNEFSNKLKNEMFLPIRNDIYSDTNCKFSYPSLHGIPEDCVLMILRYLKQKKDIKSVALTCKSLKETAIPFLLRNKSKTDWIKKNLSFLKFQVMILQNL